MTASVGDGPEIQPRLKRNEQIFLGFGFCGTLVFLVIAVWQLVLLVRAIGQQ